MSDLSIYSAEASAPFVRGNAETREPIRCAAGCRVSAFSRNPHRHAWATRAATRRAS